MSSKSRRAREGVDRFGEGVSAYNETVVLRGVSPDNSGEGFPWLKILITLALGAVAMGLAYIAN